MPARSRAASSPGCRPGSPRRSPASCSWPRRWRWPDSGTDSPPIRLGIAVAIVGPLLVAAVVPPQRLDGAGWAAGLGEVVRNRRFWVLVVVSITINICWHFLVNWIPSYLKQERGMDFAAGNLPEHDPVPGRRRRQLLGGWLSRRLAAGGRTARAAAARRHGRRDADDRGRGLGVGFAANLATAVILLSVIAAGTAAFMANYFSFTQEVATRIPGWSWDTSARWATCSRRLPAVRRQREGPHRQLTPWSS